MSKYEWERATLTLPTAATTSLKQALREWTNAFHEDVRKAAVALHKKIGTRNLNTYEEALRQDQHRRYSTRTDHFGRSTDTARNTALVDAVDDVITMMLSDARRAGQAPRQPTVDDVSHVAPKATSKTTQFRVGYDATIDFHDDRRRVTWLVEENNHAVEHAHAHPLAVVFFAFLAKVTWTRGSGGYGVGNDEYHREGRDSGGAANYTTFTYGPLGEQQKADDMGVSLAKYRKMLATPTPRASSYAFVGRPW